MFPFQLFLTKLNHFVIKSFQLLQSPCCLIVKTAMKSHSIISKAYVGSLEIQLTINIEMLRTLLRNNNNMFPVISAPTAQYLSHHQLTQQPAELRNSSPA